jgi:hypothetical protein
MYYGRHVGVGSKRTWKGRRRRREAKREMGKMFSLGMTGSMESVTGSTQRARGLTQ